MKGPSRSSRQRFRTYQQRRRERDRSREGRAVHPDFGPHDAGGGAPGLSTAEDRSQRQSASRKRSFGRLAREFWSLTRGRRGVLLASIGTLTFATLIGLVVPASTKLTFDYALLNTPGPGGLPSWVPFVPDDYESLSAAAQGAVRIGLLWAIAISVLTLTVIGVVVGMWGRWNTTRLTKLLQAQLRRRVFSHAVRLPLDRVYALKSGGASSLLREDAGNAAELLFSLLYNPWRAVIQLAGALAVLMIVDWRLVVLALAVLPALWHSQRLWIKRLRPVFKDIRLTRQTIDARVTEAFAGMRVVRGFARERGEAARFTVDSHLMARQELLAWWWSRAIEIVWMVLIPLASAGVLVYGGSMVVRGTLTIGDVVMFLSYLMMLLGPLEALTASATAIQTQLAALDRVIDVLEEPAEFAPGGADRPAGDDAAAAPGPRVVLAAPPSGDGTPRGVVLDRSTFRGGIRLESVSFRYPGANSPVLADIDLDAPAGTSVALVGPSGAGKTTLCNLVARFYDPTSGRVTADGHDLRGVDLASYRSLLGIVEQDVFLFDGSVAENIAYSAPDASAERVHAAAEAANAHEFISRLDRGYDTLIGERGVRLSGGQKQRIAIARALLADPRVLILDEATSNLDTESEVLIQRSLQRLLARRTSFIIAHRLSTIRHADQIVVLDRGRIIETGTHDELASHGGRYWEMLKLQLAVPPSPPPARGPSPQPSGLAREVAE